MSRGSCTPPDAATNPCLTIIVNIVTEYVNVITHADSENVVQPDLTILNRPIRFLREGIRSLCCTDGSNWVHIGEFFDGEVLDGDVIGGPAERVVDHAGLDRMAGRVVVEIDDVVGVIEPPFAGAN